MKRIQKLIEYDFFSARHLAEKPELVGIFYLNCKALHNNEFLLKINAYTFAVGLYDWSLFAKHQLLYNFPMGTLFGMGTERHYPYIEKLAKNKVDTYPIIRKVWNNFNLRFKIIN